MSELTCVIFEDRCIEVDEDLNEIPLSQQPITGEGLLWNWSENFRNPDNPLPIRYLIRTQTNDIMGNLEKFAITRAWSRIYARVGLRAQRISETQAKNPAEWRGPEDAYVTIDFVSGDRMVNDGALAEANKRLVRVNDDWQWRLHRATGGGRSLESTLTHEFGHVYGSPHTVTSECPSCVMNPFYSGAVDWQDHELTPLWNNYGRNTRWDRNDWYQEAYKRYWNRNILERYS